MTDHKTFKVVFENKAWKIMDGTTAVGSYAVRAVATRRAAQKAEAAVSRGEKVQVVLYNRKGEIQSTRFLPTARKPRTGAENERRSP